MQSASQILLPLESRRADRFEDFIPGPNVRVINAIDELLRSAEGCIFLRGPEGCGKTHLLNAAFNRAMEQGLQAFYINLGKLPEAAADGLSGLETMDLVCVDDVDLVIGNPVWEKALFNFFNRLRAEHGSLLISSSQALSSLQFGLPDLASRLAWGLRLQLEPMDDQGKLALLLRESTMEGMELPEDVARYLLNRGSRSLTTLLDTAEAIRQAALREKRRITIPLAREVLAGD